MHSIHAAKVGLWISIHNPQARRPPCSTEVNPETPVVCKRVPDPLGMEAMLHDLIALLPAVRRAPLEAQRELMRRAVRAAHPFEEDVQLAAVPDVQGLGGSPLSA